MLTTVPSAVRRSSRIVTLRHPNAMDCTVWRKTITRPADGPEETMGDLPTLGGMGVLDGEDEAEFEFTEIGDARILMAGVADMSGMQWNDADTGLVPGQMPVEATIEFVDDDLAATDYVRKPDLISVEPGGGIVLHFEVLGELSSVNIPPYTRRYALAQRSDEVVGVG